MTNRKNIDVKTPLTMDEAKTYMLNQGTCISYNNGERYIKDKDTEWLLNHLRPHQAREAVRSNMDLLDFDEWMAIEDLITGDFSSEKVSSETAAKLNGILWEDLDLSPMDLPQRVNQSILTPIGKLWIKEKGVYNEYPGVMINALVDGVEHELAMVEYDNSKNKLQTVVYGDTNSDEPTEVVTFETN